MRRLCSWGERLLSCSDCGAIRRQGLLSLGLPRARRRHLPWSSGSRRPRFLRLPWTPMQFPGRPPAPTPRRRRAPTPSRRRSFHPQRLQVTLPRRIPQGPNTAYGSRRGRRKPQLQSTTLRLSSLRWTCTKTASSGIPRVCRALRCVRMGKGQCSSPPIPGSAAFRGVGVRCVVLHQLNARNWTQFQ